MYCVGKVGDVPSGQSLTEVDKLPRGLKVVSVLALLGGGSSTIELHVSDQSSVRDFLLGHKVNECNVIGGDTGIGEFLGRESGCTIVEEITGQVSAGERTQV